MNVRNDLVKLNRKNDWLRLGIEILETRPSVLYKLVKVLEDDKSNLNPYHNPQHMMAVAITADKILQSDFDSGVFFKYTRNELRTALFIAASLHDIGHSGGKLPDRQNVVNSINIVKEHFSEILGEALFKQIRSTIEVTQFPFVFAPENNMERAIRDADLLMCQEPDWLEFFMGLKSETGKFDMTMEQNLDWLSQQRFFTKLGGKMYLDYTESNYIDKKD